MASVICFQEVSSRNYGTIRFERNFWTKTFASVSIDRKLFVQQSNLVEPNDYYF